MVLKYEIIWIRIRQVIQQRNYIHFSEIPWTSQMRSIFQIPYIMTIYFLNFFIIQRVKAHALISHQPGVITQFR